MSGLLDLLNSPAGRQIVIGVAGQTGQSEDGAANVLSMAMPLLLGAMKKNVSTPSGAAGTRSYEMAKCLLDAGHAVTMICGSYGMGHTGLSGSFSRGKRQGFVDGIEVIELRLPYDNRQRFVKRTLVFLSFAFRSIWIALTEKYDIIFATSTPLTASCNST